MYVLSNSAPKCHDSLLFEDAMLTKKLEIALELLGRLRVEVGDAFKR